MNQYLAGINARQRVQTGNVDPAWLRVIQRIEQTWQPNFSQIDDKRITNPALDWLAANIWHRMKNAPGSVGDSFADPMESIKRPDPMRKMLVAPDADATKYRSLSDPLLDPRSFSRVMALFEIRFDLDTALSPSSFLMASSGHGRFDLAAQESVSRALLHLENDEIPPGPSKGVVSLSASFDIQPVLPLSGLGTELLLPLLDPVIPANKSVSKRVELVLMEGNNRRLDK